MAQFHWADYMVMVAMLLASMATGIFFAFWGRGQGSVEEYLMAGRRMNVLPVAFSTFVTWMSGISFLGDPVECYKYGAIYFFLVLGYILSAGTGAPFTAKIHDLHFVSIYEFLEAKYSRSLRTISSVCNIVSMADIVVDPSVARSTSNSTEHNKGFTLSAALFNTLILWLGIATYAPALGLSQASGIPVWASISILGGVCTFYVSLGGMKAVIWADTVQMVIMVAGMLAVVIQGSLKVGGITNVFRIAGEGGRINILESAMNFNPTAKASLWTFFLGGLFRVNLSFICAQHVVQRFCTVPTARDARNVALMTMPMFAVMSSLIAMCGMVMYANYADCDPLLNGEIERMDQLVPHLVLDLLGFLPGIPGLFLSAVFSASLSSMSSGMNAISALGLTDIAIPLYKHIQGRTMKPGLATRVAKIIALSSGITITASAFMTSALGKSIFAFNALLGGAFMGPTSAIVFTALVFPKVRSLFVHIAFVGSICTCLVMGILAQVLPPRGSWEELPLSTAGCHAENVTQGNVTYLYSTVTSYYPSVSNFEGTGTMETVTTGGEPPPFRFSHIYQMNGLLYGPFGFFLSLLISLTLHAVDGISTRIRSTVSADGYSTKKELNQGSKEEKENFEFLTPVSGIEEHATLCENGTKRANAPRPDDAHGYDVLSV